MDTTSSSSVEQSPESGAPPRRLLIVSNRLPITLRRQGTTMQVVRSAGGLATGLKAPHERSGGFWIGWPGDLDGLDNADVFEARRQLHEMRAIPVTIQPDEATVFYEEISNGVLWPLVHDRLDRLPLRLEGWDVYERVNERFADVVAGIWQPGDLVWVHDYQLMRLPLLLRQRLPQACIGFFLHVPFPNPEVFLALPVRNWLVEGMLGADLIGFHTRRYRGHFTAALRRLFGLEMDADGHVRHEGRAVKLGIFPMGVDARDISQRASERAVNYRVLEHRAQPAKMILGIDRLDYSKGIPRRLAAFERLLIDHPELRGHVRLVQLAVPSRGGVSAYRKFRKDVELLISRINGRYASASWTPIQYMHRSIDDDELYSLYRAAEVMMVTPLRDGMNLVSKEFIAARSDEGGVLLLSEFAGAADELAEAIIVNPYDVDGVALAMHQALTMDGAERRRRMRALRERVFQNDVHAWSQRFLDALAPAAP
ncbi:MAG: trehalose-6-phosphate synthase [Gemmatimonadaceae bacterium]